MKSVFDSAAIRARAEVAIAVALETGREAARFRRDANPGALAVENKGLQDFVTVADKKAEQAIRDGLISRFPDDTFMGEESGGRSGAAGTWVVDPIDGTTNYIRASGIGASQSLSSPAAGSRSAWYTTPQRTRSSMPCAAMAPSRTGFPFMRLRPPIRPMRWSSSAIPAKRVLTTILQSPDGCTNVAWTIAAWARPPSTWFVSRRVPPISITNAISMPGICLPALIAKEAGAIVAMPAIDKLLADGGPVIAHAPGLAGEFAFILDIEGLMPSR